MPQDLYLVIIPVVSALIAAAVLVVALVLFRRRRGRLVVEHGRTKASFTSADARKHPAQELTTDESDVRRNDFRLRKGVRVGIYNSIFRRNTVTIVDSGTPAPPDRRPDERSR